MVGLIIALILILVIIGIIYYAYLRIRAKVREFSNMAFGTNSIGQGLRQLDEEAQVTPRSVTAGTSIYLPRIVKDFPEFHLGEMKTRAENVLTSYLKSINDNDYHILVEGTNELEDHLRMRIEQLKNQNKREHYEQIKTHRTEIARYYMNKGMSTVVFQTSVEYVHYIENSGTTVPEETRRLKQAKYNIHLVYIQDQDFIGNTKDEGFALNCPNCNAPLKMLGEKKCPYCDTPVIEFNLRVWNFNKVEEV